MGLAIEGVGKEFVSKHNKTHALDNIEIEIKEGEFVCILGPSGCGKSTLLNIIAGLEKPSQGRVFLQDEEIAGPGRDRVLMFQESALFPWLRVIDNVEFGMKMAGVPKVERREKALKYLKMVHLFQFQDSFVHELSGGMKQRVSLARALALDSDVLLMDEPFAALDSQTRNILQGELQRIWLETKKTIVFVTHNVEEAVFLADRVIVMSANPGRIQNEFTVPFTKPRQSENEDLAFISARIKKELKWEAERVAQKEYDSDWTLQKGGILPAANSPLGIGLQNRG